MPNSGFGWSALPRYLCDDALERGSLVEIAPPIERTRLNYHLVWSPSALRKSRVAHARQTILWNLGPAGSRR